MKVEYTSRADEVGIMKATPGTARPEIAPVLDGWQILRYQEAVRQVVVGDHVFNYAADLVRASRPKEPGVPKWVPELASWGGPGRRRASS